MTLTGTTGLGLPRARYHPNNVRAVQRDGVVVLRGEADWLLEGPAAALDAAQAAVGAVSERLGPELLLLTFGNAVGRFDVPGLGTIEVESSKADATDFDRLLRELMEVATALPFAAGAAAALPYDRSVAARTDILYHAFVYLRRVLSGAAPRGEQLLAALRVVLQDPHQRFERVREVVPIELAHRVDAGGLMRLATGQEPLERVGAAVARRLPLARILRGHVPSGVEQVYARSTPDTAENRFVKAFLEMADGVLEAMATAVSRKGNPDAFGRRILAECEAMERSLRPIRAHSLWTEVGRMTHLPAGSTVLQRRRGYRDVFRHFARLRLAARVPLPRDLVWDLLEARDIAELYELWCFFALVRLIEGLLGPPSQAGGPEAGAWGLSVRWGLSVSWPGGVRLLYNPRFTRSRPPAERSYSVPLRPDIGLLVPTGPNAGLHLFDAKFRLDKLDDVLPMNEGDATDLATEERRGTFKRADLYKMHTYRDAIPTARSVWILYPGTEGRFFSAMAGAGAGLGPILDGVGALPAALTDGADLAEVRHILAMLLGVSVGAE